MMFVLLLLRGLGEDAPCTRPASSSGRAFGVHLLACIRGERARAILNDLSELQRDTQVLF